MSSIVKVEIGQYDYAFAGEFKFFEPSPDGRVVRPSILVRLTDEDGFSGWGQAVPVPSWSYETAETVTSTLAHYLAPRLLGADPTDFADVHDRMNQAIRPGLTTGQPLCKAAVDLACYDLTGKQRGKSVSYLLGATAVPTQLTLSWTINATELSQAEQQLEAGRARGYHHFNFKVGPPQTPAYDLALARLVHDFAPAGFCWADANTGYDLATALEVLPKLADSGVDVLESPLPPMDVRGYQSLRKQGALPIVMDEGLISSLETEAFITWGMMDGLTLKVGRSAGIWQTRQIAELAQQHGLFLLGSGLCDPDLSLAASVHVFSWAGIEKPCALNGPQYLAESLDTNRSLLSSDQISVPTAAGLGLAIHPRAAAVLTTVAEVPS